MKNLMKNYGKGIFAVLGAFLMLTFTLPSFMKNMQDPGASEVGRLKGKKVTSAEISQAMRELSVLGQFRVLPQLLSLVRDENETERGTHWFLLLREAGQAGMIATDGEIRDAVTAAQLPESQFNKLLSDSGLSQQDLRACAAHALMVLKWASLAANGAQTPAPEIEYRVNEDLSSVRMQYATIDGTEGWNKQSLPTVEKIKKQFDLYKDVVATPAGSDTVPAVIDGHVYPFGYKYPDRVKIEYLKFDRAMLGSRFQPTREDYQEAYKYYSAHLSEFQTTSSTSLTVGGKQKAFEDVRDQLVKDQVAGRVNKLLNRVADRALETAKQPWNSAKPDEGGFRETLAREKWTDYKTLAQDFKQSKEFDGYAPEYVQIGAWQGGVDLGKDDGIGEAYYETPAAHYPFADVATHLRELELPKDNFPRLFLQVGTEGPLLRDGAGNLYIFRVTEAAKSHDAGSLEEVRGQVAQDLQKLAAYQEKQSEAKSLAAAAATDDLTTLAKLKGFAAHAVPEITHTGRDLSDVRGIPGLVDAAFELARQPAATQPASTQPSLRKTTTVNVDSMLKIFVVAVDAFNRVSPETFAANRERYVQAAKQEYGEFMLFGWVRLDAVARRLNYVPKVPFATQRDMGPSAM